MDKYIHPNLRVEVPKELRLEIYKKAVEYYNNCNPQKDWGVAKTKGRGLCVVLPCILWDLVSYCENPPHLTESWDWGDSVVAFPELQKVIYYFKSYKKRTKNPVPIRFRVNALKRMIKEVKSKN